MVATEAELASLEQFFSSIEIPTTLKINKATTYEDLPGFINNALKTIKSDAVSELTKRVRWDDLCQIRDLLEKK